MWWEGREDHRNPLISWMLHPGLLIPSEQRGAWERGPSQAEEPLLLLVKGLVLLDPTLSESFQLINTLC